VRVKVHLRKKAGALYEFDRAEVMPTVSGMLIMALQRLANTDSAWKIQNEKGNCGDGNGMGRNDF